MRYDSAILFDWLSFTAKHMDEAGIIELLGMRNVNFEPGKGSHGWTNALYYDGIKIFYGGRDDCVWCDMSGKGCRAYETHGKGDWKGLFEDLRADKDFHVTRLDPAFDERLGLFDLNHMKEKIRRGEIVSKLRWGKGEEGLLDEKGNTIYIGSPRSLVRFRLYDKAVERGREEEGHWVRFEIQLRDENAERFIDKLAFFSVGELFISVVNNYIRFVEPGETDSNKRRWETSPFWYNFIGTAGKVSLYVAPGEEYNLGNLESFVISQAGAAAAVLIDIIGVDEFISRVRTQMLTSKNPKYKKLRAERSMGKLPPHIPDTVKLPPDTEIICDHCGKKASSSDFTYYSMKTKRGLCRDCDSR